MRLSVVVISLSVLVTALSGAGLGAGADYAVPLDASHADDHPGLTGKVTAVTAALEAGDYGQAFRAMAQAQGLELPTPIAVASPAHALEILSRGELDRSGAEEVLAHVAPAARGPVGDLLVAIAKADRLVQDANAALGAQELYDQVLQGHSWTGAQFAVDVAAPADAAPVLPGLAEADRAPDTGAYLAAQAILLDAVADAVPEISQLSSHTCPPVNMPPFLMVCLDGSQTYTAGEDAILIVDLDGDDIYENAQGSPFAAGLPQVIIDVAGNDRYERVVSAASGTIEVVGQGAGVLGVGGVVDLQGNDVYRAHAMSTSSYEGERVTSLVTAQGAGFLGAGFLIDLGGVDCAEAIATGHGSTASVIAQGAGALGAGLAAFLGVADPSPQCLGMPYADTLSLERVVLSTSTQLRTEFGPGITTAQGAGGGPLFVPGGISLATGGAGAYVGGLEGNTYTASSKGGFAATVAQGAGLIGIGAHADLGGADDYTATAEVALQFINSLSGSFSFAEAITTANLGDTVAAAQGGGFLAGIGAHSDVGTGADHKHIGTIVDIDVGTSVHTTYSPGTTSASNTLEVGRAIGIGQGGGDLGVGVEVDAGGDDVRSILSNMDVHGAASATGGSSNTASSSTTTGDADANGQGSGQLGIGVLADALGSDAYRLSASLVATSVQNGSPGSLTTGSADTAGQAQGGSLVGIGVLADVAGFDTYSKSPGSTAATDDACYTNSPPSDLRIGLGIDALSVLAVPAGCILPPH